MTNKTINKYLKSHEYYQFNDSTPKYGYIYKVLIRNLFALTGGKLMLSDYSFVEDKECITLSFLVYGHNFELLLLKSLGCLDTFNLMYYLNSFVHTFIPSGNKWYCRLTIKNEKDLGFAFITREKEIELINKGLIIRSLDNLDSDLYLSTLEEPIKTIQTISIENYFQNIVQKDVN